MKNQSRVNQINFFVSLMKDIEIDGEMMEEIIRNVGMDVQMLRQLVLKADSIEVAELLSEKKELGTESPKYGRLYLCNKGAADVENTNVVFMKGDVVLLIEVSEGEVVIEGVTGWCEGFELSLNPKQFTECFEYHDTIRLN